MLRSPSHLPLPCHPSPPSSPSSGHHGPPTPPPQSPPIASTAVAPTVSTYTALRPSPTYHQDYRPQLSERDSIFATTYLASSSDSSTESTPRLPPRPAGQNTLDESNRHVATHFQLPAALSSEAAESSLLSRPARFPASITRSGTTDHMSFHSPLDPTTVLRPRLPRSRPTTDDNDGAGTTPIGAETIPLGSLTSPSRPSGAMAGSSRTQSAISLRRAATWMQPNETVLDSSTAMAGSATFDESSKQIDKSKRSSSKGHIDHQIEATLANEEPVPNARSRKASHYLGLFKENVPAQEQKRGRERTNDPYRSAGHTVNASDSLSRAGREKTGTVRPDGSTTVQTGGSQRTAGESGKDVDGESDLSKHAKSIGNEIPVVPSTPDPDLPLSADGSDQLTPATADPPDRVDAGESIEWRSNDSVAGAIPLRLLEDIRNPPSAPPLRDKFRPAPKILDDEDLSRTTVKPVANTVHPAPTRLRSQVDEVAPVKGDEEEDDYESDKEQISSATYYPHQGPSPVVSEDNSPDQTADDYIEDAPLYASSATSINTAESVEPPPNKGPSSTRLRDRSRDDSDAGQASPKETSSSGIVLPTMSDTEGESCEETTQSERGDDSGLTDGELTPTATADTSNHPRRSSSQRKPLGAVELKPYQHQVGGHTKVFSFSKQAICKQLNNRENEFYERVERRHPELLRFLPRYASPPPPLPYRSKQIEIPPLSISPRYDQYPAIPPTNDAC